jgi:bifunctional non-homologous end joining protein LigD
MLEAAQIPSQIGCQMPIFDACSTSASPPEPPAFPTVLHEIKSDGYRLRVERDGDRVRLITKGGYDWSRRYPWIVETALKNRQKQFVIDGEAVILGVDGYSDFNALHSRKHDDEVQLYAFDVLALDGDDLRKLPPTMRKTNLARLLARRSDGISVAPCEAGEIGPDLFRAACRMGLEGLVSKHRDRAYRGGPCSHWVKVKNRNSPGNETSGRGRLVALMERPQKITFAEMRASGVRGLLIYCSDYHCSHWTAISGDQWPDDFGCPIWSRDLPVRLAAGAASMSARTSTGKRMRGAIWSQSPITISTIRNTGE